MRGFLPSRMQAAFFLSCCVGLAVMACPQQPVTSQTSRSVEHANEAVPAVEARPYRIAPGDEISVTFPYNRELNQDGPVGPDGKFTLPIIGSLDLAGKTIPEAAESITYALRNGGIVQNAYPIVSIQHFGSSVYVGGEVHLPGVVQLSSGMDALQAVIAAGGFLDTAKTRQVAIIRRDSQNKVTITHVDLKAFTQGRAEALVILRPSDIIFVPKSNIAEVDAWVDNYINKTIPFSRNLSYTYGSYGSTVVSK